MALTMTKLPRAMLIDMDDTILSAYGRPEIAWNKITAEYADELEGLPPQLVAIAILTFARNFWSTAEPTWRLRLGEARRLTVKGGFAALAAAGHGHQHQRHQRAGPVTGEPADDRGKQCDGGDQEKLQQRNVGEAGKNIHDFASRVSRATA